MTIRRYASSPHVQRIACLVLLAVICGACGIDWLGWRMFGGHEGEVAVAVGIAATFYLAWLFETVHRE